MMDEGATSRSYLSLHCHLMTKTKRHVVGGRITIRKGKGKGKGNG